MIENPNWLQLAPTFVHGDTLRHQSHRLAQAMAHRMNAGGRDGPERERAGRSGWWAEKKPVFLFGGGARSGSRANAH
eukprot:14337724-Alexandrium_andersonii.AAC.1